MIKIRRSFKFYFFCAIMAIATITVVSFSTLAANYFVSGMDISLRYSMLGVVRHVDTSDGKPKELLGYQVATRWQDVQQPIKHQFSRPTEHLQFEKKMVHDGWLTPPLKAYFLMRYDREGGQTVYISRIFNNLATDPIHNEIHQAGNGYGVNLIIYALVALFVFGFGLFFLFRHTARPQERLFEWAQTLTTEQLKQPIPDFQFHELNRIAAIIKESISSTQAMLTREQRFLASASHELRTPIAVVRSNAELMDKLISKTDNPALYEKQAQVMRRILRAGVTMTDLCETLLWLNRCDQRDLPVTPVNLALMIDSISRDLRYLLRDKPVEVEIDVQESTYPLPSTLCRIVISNLIRNAYQHTLVGQVSIVQSGTRVTIINRNSEVGEQPEELGFGLGLELTNRIIQQYDWSYHTIDNDDGREVTIDFAQD
ncbi:sensor histidine kinase [Vibrio palustris]|uniref:histidine kinase n=1 Tax=Vibrio palustris TaxID=1918946 RepID=A0A1R4B348_9VIBR|nr:HAMP domain-containing sensor histidine kinase [Vibrio palustris]SJL83342.1 putative sensor histidine kinase TcrY [Vibrio palustris]